MSSIVALDKTGFRLGQRLERKLNPDTAGFWAEMDNRLLYRFSQVSAFKNRFSNFKQTLQKVHSYWDSFADESDEKLQLHWRECEAKEERCALIAEIIYRETQLRAHDEQIYAAWMIRNEYWIEMGTGEGKSLVAAFAATWVAIDGMTTHVVTTNDYLVQRDADRFATVFERAGLTVAAVLATQNDRERAVAYSADIVYVTGKQIGFDYLRDCMAGHNGQGRMQNALQSLMPMSEVDAIQKGLGFAIVDEIDSVLIDDARTPLVLAEYSSTSTHEQQAESALALGLAAMLIDDLHYVINRERRTISLTEDGKSALKKHSKAVAGPWLFARFRHEKVVQALTVMHIMKMNRDFIMNGTELELIDHSTGRSLPDRQLPHGMHQMLQVHVGSTLSSSTESQLSITFRGLFCRYRHLAGMSGTLRGLEQELHTAFGARFVSVPLHIPHKRKHLQGLMFNSAADQRQWLVSELKQRQESGQPVLVGVRTVDESEALSTVLNAHEIKNQLINATHDDQEAEAVLKAGNRSMVTVATNMAGRGTDIPLQKDTLSSGGLYVIGFSLNESKRTDLQLFGRAGRQGEPGTIQQVLSLEDPLIIQHVSLSARSLYHRLLKHWPSASRFISFMLVTSLQEKLTRKARFQREKTWQHNQDIERRLVFGIHHGRKGKLNHDS